MWKSFNDTFISNYYIIVRFAHYNLLRWVIRTIKRLQGLSSIKNKYKIHDIVCQ